MPPKKIDETLMELLVEMEEWVTTHLNVVQFRKGDCFKAKLRQLNGVVENRFYMSLMKGKWRHESSPASAKQIAKLNCIVITTEEEDRKCFARRRVEMRG